MDLQHLIYIMARDILVSSYNFPVALKEVTFDPKFAVRGLSVDTKNGVLCKLNHVQRVGLKSVCKGKKILAPHEIEEIYGESRHVSHSDMSQMKPLNDQFAMAEACLIADAIEMFEFVKAKTGENYSPSVVIEDVRSAIEEIHITRSLHRRVTEDLDRYIAPSPDLLPMLEHLRVSGKSLFLCTNR